MAAIRNKRDLLEGICAEAVGLLRERPVRPGAIREIRRATPMRQIEMAELMIASRNFTVAYAKCLVAATPQKQLVDQVSPKDVKGLTPEDVARIERETQTLESDFRSISESHGQNVLNLVVAGAYVRRLLDNLRIGLLKLGLPAPASVARARFVDVTEASIAIGIQTLLRRVVTAL